MDSNKKDFDRRDFIKTTAAAGLGVALGAHKASAVRLTKSAGEKVRVAVIGVNGRGIVHAQNYSKLPNSEVAYICDVDANVIGKGLEGAKGQKRPPKSERDFRRILDDKSVDAISIAAPDHWHTPMTLLG